MDSNHSFLDDKVLARAWLFFAIVVLCIALASAAAII
jgi:hypothetical protein